MGIILGLVLIAMAVVWVYQFAFLMSLDDAYLRGRHDKLLWCAAFILLPFVTPFAFILWRTTNSTKGRG